MIIKSEPFEEVIVYFSSCHKQFVLSVPIVILVFYGFSQNSVIL